MRKLVRNPHVVPAREGTEVLQHWQKHYQAPAQVPAMLEAELIAAAWTSAQHHGQQNQQRQQDALQDSSAHHAGRAGQDASPAHPSIAGLPGSPVHYQPGRPSYTALGPADMNHDNQQQDTDDQQEQEQQVDDDQQQQQLLQEARQQQTQEARQQQQQMQQLPLVRLQPVLQRVRQHYLQVRDGAQQGSQQLQQAREQQQQQARRQQPGPAEEEIPANHQHRYVEVMEDDSTSDADVTADEAMAAAAIAEPEAQQTAEAETGAVQPQITQYQQPGSSSDDGDEQQQEQQQQDGAEEGPPDANSADHVSASDPISFSNYFGPGTGHSADVPDSSDFSPSGAEFVPAEPRNSTVVATFNPPHGIFELESLPPSAATNHFDNSVDEAGGTQYGGYRKRQRSRSSSSSSNRHSGVQEGKLQGAASWEVDEMAVRERPVKRVRFAEQYSAA